jgi:hypothetical protein
MWYLNSMSKKRKRKTNGRAVRLVFPHESWVKIEEAFKSSDSTSLPQFLRRAVYSALSQSTTYRFYEAPWIPGYSSLDGVTTIVPKEQT